jgi:hypothetical protein
MPQLSDIDGFPWTGTTVKQVLWKNLSQVSSVRTEPFGGINPGFTTLYARGYVQGRWLVYGGRLVRHLNSFPCVPPRYLKDMSFNCTRLLATFATLGLSGAQCVDVCKCRPAA